MLFHLTLNMSLSRSPLLKSQLNCWCRSSMFTISEQVFHHQMQCSQIVYKFPSVYINRNFDGEILYVHDFRTSSTYCVPNFGEYSPNGWFQFISFHLVLSQFISFWLSFETLEIHFKTNYVVKDLNLLSLVFQWERIFRFSTLWCGNLIIFPPKYFAKISSN